jgi:hypothetical protein
MFDSEQVQVLSQADGADVGLGKAGNANALIGCDEFPVG